MKVRGGTGISANKSSNLFADWVAWEWWACNDDDEEEDKVEVVEEEEEEATEVEEEEAGWVRADTVDVK